MAHWITGQGGSPQVKGSTNETRSDEPTILIIGAGTFGTSAAYHLAQNYQDASKITIVDRAQSPPKPAAAVDINRVIRTDYAKPMYNNLAYEAWHAWFWSLELQPYFHQTGWLMMDDTPDSSLSHAIREQYRRRGWDPTEDVALNDLNERWGGIMEGTNVEGFSNAYFSPETGWCDAAGATEKLMQSAESKGIQRVTANVEQLMLDDDNSRVLGVRTEDGQQLKADQILVTAGAWTSSLFSSLEDVLQIPTNERIENQLRTIGVLQAYYPVSAEEVKQFEDNKAPVIVYGQQGEVIPPHSKAKLLKYTHNHSFSNTITTKSGAKISAPAGNTWKSQVNDIPDKLKREAEEGILSKLLPNFTKGREADHYRICYDARTPTEDFLICQYPHAQLSNLFIASGGSSHAYK